MSEWKEYKLGDLTELVTKGTTPTTLGGGFAESGINFIKSEAIRYDGRIDKSTFVFIDFQTHEKLKRSHLKKDDILFSMAGIFLGKNALVTEDILPANTNQALAIIRLRKDRVVPRYVHYFLRQKNVIEHINNMSGQSAQPNINFEEIKSIKILLPELPEQHAIAEVLSSLDDKIDLLHRQNKTLEALAETLFRQWFVEEECISWKECRLSDLCTTITKGTTPTTLGHQFTEYGINFIKVESITESGDFIPEKFAKIDKETHSLLNRSIICKGDILCSIAGTIGRIAIVKEDILPANTNQAIAILRANKEKCFPEFIYLFLKSSKFRELMDGKIVHAVQPNLSLSEIGNTELKMPPMTTLEKFKEIIMPIFEKKNFNVEQIQVLTRLRDTLLPKLMSGEVRVKSV